MKSLYGLFKTYFFEQIVKSNLLCFRMPCFKALIFFIFFTPSRLVYGLDPSEILSFPSDIRVSIFADYVPGARHMAFDDQGILFLSQTKKGAVIALPDEDKNGFPDQKVTIASRRDSPHGLAFVQLESGYYLYIAEEHQVIRMKRIAKPFAFSPAHVVIGPIPGGGHSTRTIKIKDQKLYLSVGSSCNICEEDNPIRAAISYFDLDGENGRLFARGLRNTVGMEFSPYNGKLFGVNNGSDRLGDNFPMEELNIIEKGKHYGWPYCHNSRKPDPKFGKKMKCSQTEGPSYTFTAHMAPLGLAFYQKGSLPDRFDNSLFIAFHGSWNRSVPSGYKVLRIILNGKGEILSHENFITGFLRPDGRKVGRPVDVEKSPGGDLYVSDDYGGIIYKIAGKTK